MTAINVFVEKPKAGKNESFESLFRRFKKGVRDAKVMEDVKNREYFVKPSKVKRDKRLKKC